MSFDATTIDVVPNPPRFIPKEFSVFNYKYALEAIPIARYYINTFLLTLINTAISVFTAMACGYAFSKGKFPCKGILFLMVLAVMMIPFEVRMIPLFLQYRDWNMLDTWWPLILGSFAWAYGIFLARQFIDSIPDSLRESASIDGAGEWYIFLKIILPLCGPVIATLVIFQVVNQWNNFLWPLVVVSNPKKQVISVGLAMFNASETARYLGPRLAVSVLGAIPLMIVYLFLQKYIVQSVMLSGVKE
ncbi:carbohydrate ABC transporter permease [Suilimivivens sp.]